MSVKFLKQTDWQLIFVIGIAALLRLFLLDLRPPHHDEGVNGWFIDQMVANGFYRYDPSNYHGPFLFYITFIFEVLFGFNLFILRLPTVLFNLLTIYWIFLFSRFFGRSTCLIAALAMAVSPGFDFFTRYFDFDACMVFFEILAVWGIIGLYYEGTCKYLWAVGLGISGMICTKESYMIHVICILLSFPCLFVLEKIFPSFEKQKILQRWTIRDLALVFITCIWIIIFFYSGAFLNFEGISGIFKAISCTFQTSAIKGAHVKPFIYFADLFFKYEVIAFLGLLLCFRYIMPSTRAIRFTVIYGLGVFLAYSISPYKTPWCVISLLWPFYFVFGDNLTRLLKTNLRNLTFITATIIFLCSAVVCIRLNFFNYVNPKEPYIYVQTFNEVKKLTSPLFKLASQDISNYNLSGKILRSDEWPLPWLLRDFTRVGYFSPLIKLQDYDADFLLVESKRIEEVEKNLKNKYFTDSFFLRDAQDLSKLYLSSERFKSIFPGKDPEFVPAKGRS